MMASFFHSRGFKCDECGNGDSDKTKGYKVVRRRHLCPTCAQDLASAILADASQAAVIKWPCPQHELKEVEMLCCKCQVPVCHTCALISHQGHQMKDVQEFFNEKKTNVKKDIEVITAKQAETQIFMEKIEGYSLDINSHFKKIGDEVLTAFEIKSQDQEERKQVQKQKVNAEAEEIIRQINEKRDRGLEEINEQYDKDHTSLVSNRDNILSELKGIEDIVHVMTSDAMKSAEATKEELESIVDVAKSIMVDCDGKSFHEKVGKFHKINMDKLPSLDHDSLDKLPAVAKRVRFKTVDDKQRVGNLTGKYR